MRTLRTTAVAAAIVGLVGGGTAAYATISPELPSRQVGVTQDDSASRAGHGVVDGVEVTYLPAGMHQDGEDEHGEYTNQKSTSRTWKDQDGGWVTVTVIRGAATESVETLRADYWINDPAQATVRGKDAVVGQRAGSDGGEREILWLDHPGLGLWVGVGPGLEDEAMKIAEGLRPRG